MARTVHQHYSCILGWKIPSRTHGSCSTDTNLCPTGFAPTESRALLHFIPLNQAHLSWTSIGAALWSWRHAGIPKPCKCKLLPSLVEPENHSFHASLLCWERSQETQNATRKSDFIIRLRTLWQPNLPLITDWKHFFPMNGLRLYKFD